MTITENTNFYAGNFPQRITLELTNKCNISCTFCPRKLMAKHQGFMAKNLAFRLLAEMSEHKSVSLVPFFRGEPLLHPHVIDILQYAKSLTIGPIQFTTNASLLNPVMTERLLDIELDFLSFSLDTIDPFIYERSRRGSNYETVLNNILHFVKRRAERNLNFPEIQVSAVDTATYRPQVDDFIAFWRNKVERVRIYIEHSQDGNPGSITKPLLNFHHRMSCKKPFTDIVIYWDGKVAVCNHDWTRSSDKSLGDVNQSSIKDIWQNKQYQLLRACHTSGNLVDEPPCDHCDHWKMYYLREGFLGRLFIHGKEVLV